MGHAWRVGSIYCNQRIYIGLLLFSTITWMFMSFYRFNRTTLPPFFEENKKCLETRTDGLIAEQLWLSFHTIVNECSSKNYLVYRRHPNDELDVDHVVANAEVYVELQKRAPNKKKNNWDCTIASYGLSQSSSVEVELAEEAPYCQIYGIGSDKRNGDKFTKIGEYLEAKDLLKDHDGVVEGDRERTERRKRETNNSDSDHAEIKEKGKFVEKVQKVKKQQTEEGKNKTLNKANSKLPSKEREFNELQNKESRHRTQAHSPKRSHVNNATMDWHAELKEEPVGKKMERKLSKNKVDKEEEIGPDEVPEEEEKAFKRKLKKEKKARKQREEKQDKLNESQGAAPISDIDGDVRTKFVRERGDPEEGTEVEKSDSAAKNENGKVDKRAGYLIEHNADNDENGEDRGEDRKKVEHLLEQKRGDVLRRIGNVSHFKQGNRSNLDKLRGQNLPKKILIQHVPSTTGHEKSTSKQPDPEDDAYTTVQFDADKDTLKELGDEKAMIEDDKDYVMASTVAADSDKTPRKFLNIDIETYLLKHIKRKV
ncbi:hypothetical protein ANCDUO_03913 [Ancylostoma duodenale]|uniref:Uncharacterized protein n=1 Tax=Ancylostoma duodenale TaxID=51022 RepID=A0A0C2GW60_9BILA|nr:hypothetical protein ANCDUO_03913 [Ancylostoma duodenale]